MATRMVVCPECGAEVPYGRLSCVACGTLLASVAGAAKRTAAATGGSGRAEGPADVAAAHRATETTGPADAGATTGDRPTPAVLRDWTGPTPASPTELETPAVTAPAAAIKPPRWVRGVRSTDGSTDEPDAELGAEPEAEDDAEEAIGRPSAIEDPILAASPVAPPASTPLGTRPSLPMPGGYVAPAIVPSAATTVDGRPATASAIAAASIADGSITSVPAAPRPDRWFSTSTAPTAPTAPDASSTPGKAGLFSDLPFRAPGDIAGWPVAVGGLIGTLAFIVPWSWSENGVMGADFGTSWTSRWGLANPADLIPMAAALAVLLLAVIPNRIPIAVRGAVLPLLFGGWFLGIVWSYATGSFGLGWGVDALGVSGLLLVLGGAVAAWRLAPSGEPSTDRPSE